MAKMGYKVLFLTKEMLPSQLIDRIDAIWSGISYSRIKDGQLAPQEEERYHKYLLEEAPKYKDKLIVELIEGGVISCGSSIDLHRPDVCLIDGGYLMADDSEDDDWRGILEVWRGFKALARNRKVPILCTSQLKGETATLSNISYVKALAQDCMPGDNLLLTEFGYKKLKELENCRFKVWDGLKFKEATCYETKELKKRVIINNNFYCSQGHLVRVFSTIDSQFHWKKAKDILPNADYILEYAKPIMGGSYRLEEYIPAHGTKEIKIPKVADFNLGLFIGYLLGDGSISPVEKGQVSLSCGYDEEYADKALYLANELFGIQGKKTYQKTPCSRDKQLVVCWYSRKFSHWLAHFLYLDNQKYINPDFLTKNFKFRLGILNGLIESDGYCSGAYLRFHLKGGKLSESLFTLIGTLGLKGSYTKETNCICSLYVGLHDLKPLIPKMCFLKHRDLQFKKIKTTLDVGKVPKEYVFNLIKALEGHGGYKKFFAVNELKALNRYKKNGSQNLKLLKKIESVLGLHLLENFRFKAVQSLIVTDVEEKMYDISVLDSEDKSIIANGVLTHNCDAVYGLEQDKTDKAEKEIKIVTLKVRDGEWKPPFKMSWDFTEMKHDLLYVEEEKKRTPIAVKQIQRIE